MTPGAITSKINSFLLWCCIWKRDSSLKAHSHVAMSCCQGFRIFLSHLIYTVRPCLIHPCHALTMPFSRPRHSTTIERQPVGYLPMFSFFRLPRRVPQRLLSESYQSSSQRSIPTTVKSGSSTQQKDNQLNCRTSSSDISGYHAYSHEWHGTVGAWHVWINGNAWARHAMCQLALNVHNFIVYFGTMFWLCVMVSCWQPCSHMASGI
jgi:hypothetical protein